MLFNSLRPYLLLLLIINLLLFQIYSLSSINLYMPFSFSGDALVHQAAIKSMLEEGWLLRSNYIGMPDGFNWLDFPAFNYSVLHFLIIKMLSVFSSNSDLLANVFYLLGFSLIALSSFWVFKQNDICNSLSISFAVLYAFAPYHLYKQTNHLLLSSYYTIPLVVLVFIWLFKGEIHFSFHEKKITANTKFWLSILFLFVMAISDGYYTAFSLMFLFFTVVISFFFIQNYKTKELLFLILIFFAVMFISFGTLQLFVKYNEFVNGKINIFAKHFIESEHYGLKIRSMLSTVEGSIFSEIYPNFMHLLRIESPGNFSEASLIEFGPIGAIGFITLSLLFLFHKKQVYFNRLGVDNQKDINMLIGLSYLSLFVVLFSVKGGLATIFALFYPSVRVWARVSIILLFISFFSIGFLLNLIKNISLKRSLSFLVLIVGILGQVPYNWLIHGIDFDKANQKTYMEEAKFVEDITNKIGANSKVLYIPMYCFPDRDAISRDLQPYKDLMPYLHSSNNIQWSSNSAEGRNSCNLLRNINNIISVNLDLAITKIKAAGFNGIYIDISDDIYLKNFTELKKYIRNYLKNMTAKHYIQIAEIRFSLN